MAKKSLSLAELLEELNRHRKKLPALQKQAASLRKKLASVEAEIEALGGVSAPASAKRSAPAKAKGSASAKSKRPRNKVNLGEAIVAVLNKDKALSVQEIIAAVKKNGYTTSSKNFSTIVHQSLKAEKKRISRAGRGLYLLKG